MYQLLTTIFLALMMWLVLREVMRLARVVRRQQMQIDILFGLQDQMMRHLSQIEKERDPHGERSNQFQL